MSKTHENSIDANGEGPECLVAVRNKEGHKVVVGQECEGAILIPKVHLWWPYLSNPKGESPGYLYTLEVRINSEANEEESDVYRLPFGVRTVSVCNNTFLVNGQPFYFRGFGRHEDYNVKT
jgi:beta-glucuronidase